MTNSVAPISEGSITMLGAQGWIVLLRIVVGAWFMKAVWTKLTVEFAWGVMPYVTVSSRFIGFQPKRVAEFAAGNPVGWYKDYLEPLFSRTPRCSRNSRHSARSRSASD